METRRFGFVWRDRDSGEFLSPVLWSRQEQRATAEAYVNARLERVRVTVCSKG